MKGTSRPKIEIVRLPSTERAKILPLIDGGVQLRAQFKHHRSGDYASYNCLEETGKYYRFLRHEAGGCKLSHRGCPSLATKSCDNIFVRRKGHGGGALGFVDTTRSEEHLCRSAAAAAPSSARSKLSALLKKLSPRSYRTGNKAHFPWVLVEFSSQDVAKDAVRTTPHSDSEDSDRSFHLAVQESRERKRATQHTAQENTTHARAVENHFVAPVIVIGSPDHAGDQPEVVISLQESKPKKKRKKKATLGQTEVKLGSG